MYPQHTEPQVCHRAKYCTFVIKFNLHSNPWGRDCCQPHFTERKLKLRDNMKIVQDLPASGRVGIQTGGGCPCIHHSSIKLPPSTVHRLSAPSIQNPTPIYKLIQRAAVAAMNLWIRSTGSNCNLWTILRRYLKDILWNPNQMWFAPKDGNSSSSWSRKMKFAKESSLCLETSYTCLLKSEIPI